MLHRLLTSSLAALTMVPILASAEEAHVHGEAVLEIVIDDAGALISFEAPAIDIVGFEYLPKTDAEQAAIDEKLALLAQIETVVDHERGHAGSAIRAGDFDSVYVCFADTGLASEHLGDLVEDEDGTLQTLIVELSGRGSAVMASVAGNRIQAALASENAGFRERAEGR